MNSKVFKANKPNWLGNSAFTLVVARYCIASEYEALIFDAHITIQHAAAVLRQVKRLDVNKVSVIYSYAHNDYIAGPAAFTDCNQEKSDPPIDAVVPSVSFSRPVDIDIGNISVQLHGFHIHASDSIVLRIPSLQVLLAGDTLEATATYTAKAVNLPIHK
ncbi:hypothetical protein J3459_009823 [Metarhizium acridum]|uniref:Beta-lactamase domain-containing protein n=1 Tax=Metarhizium acridum (strain CQMa 102) TaxID=655827 RepID=E9EI20_METAQ|nr:beta-lactamase domain-containing protein [Metarhizium acridum CQMa 102]EFY84440.1 beta-lactamase domain-containing protein [Metarhizium acridum CQMa 102]KAG8408536.1 hypothetical protein J3458_019569 [Metarhizium acridum]KAG8423025.1 hypothetical protein J3459_009823 [Metarhizium acridum]